MKRFFGNNHDAVNCVLVCRCLLNVELKLRRYKRHELPLQHTHIYVVDYNNQP